MAMGNYWIKFVKYGNPNGKGLPHKIKPINNFYEPDI
jgi:hypothetical protein